MTEQARYDQSRRVRVLTVSDGGHTTTIMVGPVRGPEHLALIHRLGFYHVPVSAIAASRAAVAFVAFYEGASRGRVLPVLRPTRWILGDVLANAVQ